MELWCECRRLEREEVMREHDFVTCPRCARLIDFSAEPGEVRPISCRFCDHDFEVQIEAEGEEAAA